LVFLRLEGLGRTRIEEQGRRIALRRRWCSEASSPTPAK